MIDIKQLSFEYIKNNPVLEDINISFDKGRIIALIGRNGSGKSTFLNCLLGLEDYKGDILIDGQNIKGLSDKAYAGLVSFIPQSIQINIDFTIRDFISFGRNPYLGIGQSPTQADYELVDSNARRLGIEELLNNDINKVSGGERQLAFIARALTQETPIIIMDEPTAALDFGNQQNMFRIVKELVKDGKTIIFTTHNPNHLINLDCDIYAVKDKHIFRIEKLDKQVIKSIYNEEFDDESGSFLFKI